VNNNTRAMIEAVAILNCTDQPAIVEGIWLRQANGESTFVKTVIVDTTMVYARVDRTDGWLMMPLDQWVGVEFELKKGSLANGKTLPELLEAVKEQNRKKKAA
jgi:hypothetical protein